MAHDRVIRGGEVVDGSGREPFRADVAIDGDAITAIGQIETEGREEIDASGCAVTPGFVDIHTHLDAQLGWDPMLTPVSWHGVTTAMLGNCGVTFAPVRPTDHGMLAEMMETVEDIPARAILDGLSWDWEDYGGYLDSLDALNPAINVAGLVGHCAVRFYVMGDRGVEEPATESEREQIAEVVADSLGGGAFGFSTSRFLGHYLPDGRHVPGTHAEHAELIRIAEVIREAGGGLMQNVLKLPQETESEFELLRKEARASGDRVLFSIATTANPNSGRRINDLVDGMAAEGLDVSAVSIPRGSGIITGLVNLLPWRSKAWKRLSELDFEGRVAALDDEAFCSELVEQAIAKGSQLPASEVFPLGDGDTPNYRFTPEQSLQSLAKDAGEHPAETFLRISRETRGRALFTVRAFNPDMNEVAELISGERVLPGLGDAGAHVGQIMDSGWATFVLSHWVREEGLYTVGEAIRRMTSAPARILGVSDRGRLETGLKADINVIDLARVRERMPEFVHDFPGGHGRFTQRAEGYRATLCNGEVILRDDEHTGARAGNVMRR
jgi:N-acyl-D-aspartate/D-glutamate deacylase